jgi:hypothetical protein
VIIFSILELILGDARGIMRLFAQWVLRLLSDEQVLAWSLELRDVSSLSARDIGDEQLIII